MFVSKLTCSFILYHRMQTTFKNVVAAIIARKEELRLGLEDSSGHKHIFVIHLRV